MVNNIILHLKKERKAQKLSQGFVGKKIGLTQTWLSKLEGGHIDARLDILNKYCECLGIPIQIIMWRAIQPDQIKPDKREVYNQLKPVIDEMIETIFK